MLWRISFQRKRFFLVGVWLIGAILGTGVFLLGQACRTEAAEAKTPASKSPAEADLPDMPAPKAGAEAPSGAAKDQPPAAPPEAKPGEKPSTKSPAEAKPGPGVEPPAGPKPEPKAPAEPGTKEKISPPAKPKAEAPLPPEEELPGKEKKGPSAKPKAKVSPKEKPAEPLLEWPVNEAHRKNRAEVVNLLRAGSLNAEQIKFLTEYYSQYGLARWTQLANRAEVRKYREELFRELAQAEGQAHDQAVQIVLPLLIKMAEGNHHLAARVNAVLAIGELNRVESKGTKPPEPLSAAQPVLLQTVQNPQMPDALRVAALVGLRRHAELGAVAEPVKAQWASVLIGLVQERSPASRSAPGHSWLRQLAIEVLEVLKTPGPNGQVAIALSDVLSDTNNPIPIRVSAARALGNLDYPQSFPGDLNKLLREMGQLALDALNPELETYQKEKKLVARRLQTHLIGIYNGLNGLQKVASQPKETAALHQQILEAVRACAALFDNPKLRDADGKLLEDDLFKQLTKQKAALTEAIAAPVAPGAPAEKQKTT